MDNFYIRFTGFSNYEKEPTNTKIVDYKYETLYYNEDNALRLRNKHTSNEREIGTISTEIILISKSEDEKYTVIVTQEDILLFDCYFDLIGSLELDIKNSFIDVEWGDEEFVVVCKDKLLFFDDKMNLLGENKDYEFISVSFRSKYNLFVCATKDKIVFIESNGLEHGEHLEVVTSHLKMLNDDLLLCIDTNNSAEITVELFYSKNFYWYRKQKKNFEGEFLGVKNNSFYVKQSSKALEYTIVNNIDACNNRFYVIDGNNVLFTDLNKNKTPPPLSDFVIDCKQEIKSLDIQDNLVSILVTGKLLNFDGSFNLISVNECGKDNFPAKVDFTAYYKDAIFTFYNDKIALYTENKTQEIDLESLINFIWNKKIYCFNDKFVLQEYSLCNLNVVNLKKFGQTPCLFLNNGSFIVEGIVFNIEYDYTYSRLDVRRIEDDVFIGILKNKVFKLIKIDLEIFGETRHGTFETFFPKSYSDIFVQKLIEMKNYKKAFEMSNNNYNVFMNNYLDIEVLSKCPSKLLLSFLLEISKQFGDYRIILADEQIEKYRNEFDDEIYLEKFEANKESKEEYVKLVHPTICKLLSIDPNEDFIVKTIQLSECLDNYSLKTTFLNILLKFLDPIDQFEIILFLFIKFKRTDLAIKIAQLDLSRGIKYLMTLTTLEDIKRSVILFFDQKLITEVYRLIQQDASDISNFIEIGGNVKYRLCNLVEDRQNGVYHLVYEISQNTIENLLENLRQYVKKYVLGRELLICACCEQFKNIRNLLLELFADTTTNDLKAIKVYKYLDKNEKLVNLYLEKNMYREAIEEFRGNKEDLYPTIKKNLERTGLFYDLGMFYEEYEKNINLAIKNYLKSKRLSDVLRLIKDFDKQEKESQKQTILSECNIIMKNQLTLLDDLFKRYKKYRDRLKTINNRSDDYINDDTSFSFSVLSEKSRGRPGGIYEKEFVLEKLASLGVKIYKWREDNENLIEIFQFFDNEVYLQELNSQFEIVRDVLRSEFYELFKDDDYISYDNTKKRIEAPDLTKYI
ncbi:Putative elongator complex protein 1, partial [Nosema bombycis CQ1]